MTTQNFNFGLKSATLGTWMTLHEQLEGSKCLYLCDGIPTWGISISALM